MFEFLCGIVIFIVLIFIILAIIGTSSNTKKMAKNMESQSDRYDRYCPGCGRDIPFDAKRCPYCSKNFEANLKPDKDKTEEKEEIQKDNSNICSKCGSENTTNGKFCIECGNKL